MKRLLLILIICAGALCPRAEAPAGRLTHTRWYSEAEQIWRHVDIYVPAACADATRSEGVTSAVERDACAVRYPVLYLLHGIGGYEGSWQDMGGAIDTLEALITSGRCRPLILVMPDCNLWPIKERPVKHNQTLGRCMFGYGALTREHTIEHALSDLIDLIDSTFCTADCAIAGMSDGARMALNAANTRPDRIRSVALFSPVLRKEHMPQDSTQQYALYVGQKDFFYGNGKRFSERLAAAGHPHTWIEYPVSHNWLLWCPSLSHFLETTFP